MARVRWGACCKGFFSEAGLHYQMERSVWNHLECDRGWRAPEKPSRSCLQTSNNQPLFASWKSLWDSFPELYCVDLAEAYVTQESVSSEILRRRKGMICDCLMDVSMRNIWRRWIGKRKPVLILEPGFNKRLASRKRIMCAWNMRAHVRHGIWSTKGKKTKWKIGVTRNQERCKETSK